MLSQPYKSDELEEVLYKPLVTNFSPEAKYDTLLPRTTWFLYFAGLTSNLSQITLGLMSAWISPVSEQILSTDPNINPLGKSVTVLELSLIGAAQPTGSIVGPLLIGKCFDIFGRKPSLIALCATMTGSLIALAFSSFTFMYYITLFITGICTGLMNVGFPTYVSEITEDHNRGRMSCLVQALVPLGVVISFVTGPYLSVKIFTFICAIPVILNIIAFLTILPESPIQLVKQKDIAGARSALQSLRKKNEKEIQADIDRIEYELGKTSSKQGSCSKILTDRSSRNGLIVGILTYNLLNLSGTTALTAYLQPVFEQVGTKLPSSICALLVAIVQLFCYIGSSYAVEKFGRRTLILFSTISIIIPLFSIGLFFHLKYNGYTSIENYNFIPIVAIIMYTALDNFGNATVPIALMNDMFTNQVKATAVSVIMLSSGVLTTLTTFGMPILMESVGVQWCFWIFASNTAVASTFVYFLVPETKGSPTEILLRLLLPLNDQVWSSFRSIDDAETPPRSVRRPH